MACTDRYAQAWEYAAFFCKSQVLEGTDNSGGAGNAFLTDTTRRFYEEGIDPAERPVLYNITQGTNGPITAYDDTTVTATGVTWDDGDEYRLVLIGRDEISTIEQWLDIAAGDIHAALASSGACDCTLSSWAATHLGKLNIILSAAYYVCPCTGHVTPEQQKAFLDQSVRQLAMIIDGEIEVCQGETGSKFPARATAQSAWNEFMAAEIIWRDEMRNS